MANVNPKSLIEKLNQVCHRKLMEAAALCSSRTHYEVQLEHWLMKLLEIPDSDLTALFRHYEIDAGKVRRELEASLNRMKTGSGGSPKLSPDVLDLVREAWVLASLEYKVPRVRTGILLATLLTDRQLSQVIRSVSPELGKLNGEQLQRELSNFFPHTAENEQALGEGAAPGEPGSPAISSKTPALDQFTQNLTERAKKGELDAVVGRDNEIRQVIDILTRRRQNNPILTGEAGVGKTAVVEGLALRIAAGDVPEPLRNVILRVLDLGLLQAGAGVKGEFENRLKSVIQEVKSSPVPVILFIDEAHTLIGAGGQQGQGDAANLLKPALARGELRTIAATTFKEFKQYFEKDAALKRRFQVVRVEEPEEAKAGRMLRGLVPMLEKHHKVRITDEAVTEAVRLSHRYVPERQLPDKAVSLLDTACARVRLSQSATPPALEDTTREIEHLGVEIAAVERETALGHDHEQRLADLKERQNTAKARKEVLEKQVGEERKLVEQIMKLQTTLEKANAPAGKEPKPQLTGNEAAELTRLREELRKLQGETPLVYPVVDGDAVAEIVASWTGIPIGKMVRDEIQTVLQLADKLNERVIGQKHALEAIAQRIRTARADLVDPRRPIGVFMLVGPSGVGKTETAMALADLLYGGDRNMVIVNMSEYKEEAKISRLTGTSKGYVGYGEGGVLTNAVKAKPYSIVLLDEVEKANPSVQEIFYQVFDKGVLQNDDGEEINFKNTIVLLTSNVGTDTIMKYCSDPDAIPTPEQLGELLRPDLLKSFKPALLGRMVVVPYFPLGDTVLRKIIELQLKKIGGRLRENHKAKFEYDETVVTTVAGRCKEVESGARNVDHILTGSMLPAISQEVLTRMADGLPLHRVHVGVDAAGAFTYTID
jgi:type VI secretion system protein VasG